MTNSYPFVVSGDEFKGKRVLVTGGTKKAQNRYTERRFQEAALTFCALFP